MTSIRNEKKNPSPAHLAKWATPKLSAMQNCRDLRKSEITSAELQNLQGNHGKRHMILKLNDYFVVTVKYITKNIPK